MKKKSLLLLGIMLIITFAGAIIISLANSKAVDVGSNDKKLKVVATFYPVYLIGLNIAGQAEDIEVNSLTELNTGCLHDYQLTTEDMKLISDADVLIINGGGMESFMRDITENYPELDIIDASQGITMLKEDYESYGEEEASDESNAAAETAAEKEAGGKPGISNGNPHVWLNPQLYIKQIENVRDGLVNYLTTSDTIPALKIDKLRQGIEMNAGTYIEEIIELDSELTDITDSLASVSDQTQNAPQAVIFHDSFAYLANRAGLRIAFTVPLDSDTSLSAGDIATIIDAVRQEDIKYLFTEQQYSDSIAKQIAAETGAKVFIIDSVVTGDGAKDSYLKAMRENLKVLKEALQYK